MKKTITTLTVMAAFLTITVLVAGLQVQASSKTTAGGTARIFSGELSRVDAAAKKLWVKSSTGQEMEFQYNDQTKVSGSGESVEGLATKSGSSVKIHYEEGSNLASLIEVQEKEP